MSLIRFKKWVPASEEQLNNVADDLTNDLTDLIESCRDGDYTELNAFVRENLRGFVDSVKVLYDELQNLDERITAIEEKCGLDEFDDEEGEDDGDEGIEEES